MSDYAGLVLLPRLSIALRRLAPHVRIVVRHIGRKDGVEAVKSGEIELAMGTFPRLDGVQSKALLAEQYLCAVWKGNRKVKRRLSLEQYLSLPHLLVDAAGEPNGVVDFELARRNLQRNVVGIVPHFLVAPSMIKGTDMILTLTEGLLRANRATSDLVLLDPPLEVPEYRLSMIWDGRSDGDKASAWFRSVVSEVAK